MKIEEKFKMEEKVNVVCEKKIIWSTFYKKLPFQFSI